MTAPPNAVVRPATPQDRPGIESVIGSAFGAHAGDVVIMVRALDSSGATRAAFVADVDGEVAGYVQLSRAWVDARSALVEVLVLSPLSVAHGEQGRGIGTRLIEEALTEAERRRAPAVFLERPPAYYGIRGFEPATSHGFARPSVRIPGPAFQVAVLAAHQQWMVGQLVYPEAFWATDTVGLRDPELQQLEDDGSE